PGVATPPRGLVFAAPPRKKSAMTRSHRQHARRVRYPENPGGRAGKRRLHWQLVAMQEAFRDELDQLRARSLLRRLREIGSAQGPSVELVGQHLVNFSSNDY